MGKVGVSQEEAMSAYGGKREELNVQNLKLNEEYHVRIVGGVQEIQRSWYPYLVQNDKEEWVTTWMAPIVSKDSILESFASIDQRLTMEKTHKPPKDCKSRVAPTSSWLYSCFDRKDETPKLKKLTCNWTAGNAIQELQEKEKRGKDGFLEHGLLFMFDLWIIKRLKDKTRGDTWNNITYIVEGISSDLNPFSGKIPISAIKGNDPIRQKLIANLDKLNPPAFTPEELKEIRESDLDLEVEGKASTEDELKEMLIQKPIYLRAIGQKGQPVFLCPEELASEAKRLGIPYVMDIKDMIAYKLMQSGESDHSDAPSNPVEGQHRSERTSAKDDTSSVDDLLKPQEDQSKINSVKEDSAMIDEAVPLSDLLPDVDLPK